MLPHSPENGYSHYAVNVYLSPDVACTASTGRLAISEQTPTNAETWHQADLWNSEGVFLGSFPTQRAFAGDTIEMALSTTAIPIATGSVRIGATTQSSEPHVEHDSAGPSACLRIDGTSLYQAAMQKVYVAYYGRPADPWGGRWWGEQLAANNGDLRALIQQFGNSPEFDERYGAFDYGTLLDTIYQQMFGRVPDLAGKAFYVERLQSGALTLQSITLDVLNGAQNEDLQTISNKLEVASYFSSQIAARMLSYDSGDIDGARALLDMVTAVMGSVPSAMQAADAMLDAMGQR